MVAEPLFRKWYVGALLGTCGLLITMLGWFLAHTVEKSDTNFDKIFTFEAEQTKLMNDMRISLNAMSLRMDFQNKDIEGLKKSEDDHYDEVKDMKNHLYRFKYPADTK